MRFSLFVVFLWMVMSSNGQSLGEQLVSVTTQKFQPVKNQKRSVMKIGDKSFIQKISPLTYLSMGMMFAYQRGVTQHLSGSCAYNHSCSQYTKFSVEQLGLFKGVFLGFYQLQSCYPTAYLDYPDYKISPERIIYNEIGLEE